jgi:hypothetical protein
MAKLGRMFTQPKEKQNATKFINARKFINSKQFYEQQYTG